MLTVVSLFAHLIHTGLLVEVCVLSQVAACSN